MRTTLLSSGGMTKRLDRLIEAGLVERRPDPSDRRGLTRRGRATIDKAVVAHLEKEELLLDSLTPSERGALDGLLRGFLAGLEG